LAVIKLNHPLDGLSIPIILRRCRKIAANAKFG